MDSRLKTTLSFSFRSRFTFCYLTSFGLLFKASDSLAMGFNFSDISFGEIFTMLAILLIVVCVPIALIAFIFKLIFSSNKHSSICLSDELAVDNPNIRAALDKVLSSFSAKRLKEESFGAIGGQEVLSEDYEIGRELVWVTEETFIGIELNGPKNLILKILEDLRVEIMSK